MGSRVATGALNQMLHTPVVQSEPSTFHNSLSCSSSTSCLSCQWFRGRSSRKLKKKKTPQTPSPGGSQQITWLSVGTAAAAAGRLWPGCWTARLGPAAAACGSWPEEYCTRSCSSYTEDKIEYDALSVPEGDRNSSLTQLKHIHTVRMGTQWH